MNKPKAWKQHLKSLKVCNLIEDKGAFGYNAETDTYDDLMEAGIMDPTKVARLTDFQSGHIILFT